MNPTMFSILAQRQLPEAVTAIRDRFQRAVPISDVFVDILILLVCVALPGLLVIILRKFSRRVERAHPFRLFNRALKQLPLTPDERRTLYQMAHALRLANPATLLLSPSLFAQLACEWSQSSHSADPSVIKSISAKLFASVEA